MTQTISPTPEAKIVEGSDGLLLEIDGHIVPNYDATFSPFEEGDVVSGRVVRIDNDEVLVDIGYKSEGVIPSNELSIRKNVDPHDEVELGEEVDALVLTKEDQDGRLIVSKKRARFEKAWRNIEAAAESGQPVTGTVIEVVKGGLIVDLGVRGFLPASLVDIRRVPNLDEYMGQPIECKVIELNRSRNNVVLSRRAVLEEERKEQRQEILDRLQPGLVVEGVISNIVDFGAFVDLNGIDGLIHISELSWSHVNHPSEILNIGDTVQVKVLDIDRDRQRISLGLKQTQEDPWQRVVDTYNVGDELEGTVTKVVTFGAFVEILDGVEGLVHISELAAHHVENPREVVQPGDVVRVKILEIDSERRRLSLSIKRVEGQVLPSEVRAREAGLPAPGEAAAAGAGAGDLDDVADLGLSEDVFAGEGDPDAAVADDDAGRRRPRSRTATPPWTVDEADAAVEESGRCRSRPPGERRAATPRPRPRLAAAEADEAPEAEAARGRRRGPGRRGPAAEAARLRRRTTRADGRGRIPSSTLHPAAAPTTVRPPAFRVPFVGLTGGLGSGKSTALRGARRASARRRSPPTRSCTSSTRSDAVRDAVVRALGRGGRARRRRRPRRDRPPRLRRRPPSASGSRGCCGRWSASGSGRSAPSRRPPTRRRRPRWWRRRCSSRPGWTASTTRRSRSSPTRTCARARAAARGHEAVDERAARQLSQDEKAQRATFVVHNDGTEADLEAALSAVLGEADDSAMSTRTATSHAPRRRRRRARRRSPAPRRSCAAAACWRSSPRPALALVAVLALQPLFHHAVKEIALPLRHEDIIRQQAHDKGLDPALIAGVIYAESHFIDGRTSSAGAAGPDAADAGDRAVHRAASPAARAFRVSDLGTPQVNIAYGAFYLRVPDAALRRRRAAGAGGLQRGRGQRRQVGRRGARQEQDLDDRRRSRSARRAATCTKVLDARKQYRATYRHELGL